MGITKKKVKVRLLGIDTPEMRSGTIETKKAAVAARDRLRELVLGKSVILQTVRDKTGIYGRYLGNIWTDGRIVVANEDGPSICINELLISEGHATEYIP